MKPLSKSAMLGIVGLLLAALFTTAALTNEEPASVSRPFYADSTNLGRMPASSAHFAYLDGKPEHSQPLKPGVYQTRPYAIILIVPKTGIDDACVNGGVIGRSIGNSKMPNAKPDVEAIPKTPSQ